MIKVEDVQEKARNAVETVKDNEESLKTGTVGKVDKQSYWPWILLASAALVAGWYFLWRKKSNTNAGIQS